METLLLTSPSVPFDVCKIFVGAEDDVDGMEDMEGIDEEALEEQEEIARLIEIANGPSTVVSSIGYQIDGLF